MGENVFHDYLASLTADQIPQGEGQAAVSDSGMILDETTLRSLQELMATQGLNTAQHSVCLVAIAR